jgi:hypothetical protein
MRAKVLLACISLIGLGACVASAEDVKTFCSAKGCDKKLSDILKTVPIRNVDTQQTFDIANIKLGDAFSNSKAKIKTINPKYEITQKDEIILGIEGKRPYSIDEFAIAKDANGKVWLVSRYQALEGSNRIKADVFFESIFQKYGQPSEEGMMSYSWYYDRNGKQFFPKKSFESHICKVALAEVRGILPTPSDTCGKIIRVSFQQIGDFITEFSVGIANHKDRYDQISSQKNKPKL